MAKSDKATVMRRVQEVVKLLLAGAEFADIKQFATDQNWQVQDRQVRRYMELAYRRMAKASKRDRDQLMGRHLMQRRALYARCLKSSDLRTALAVLKDEASLYGIYPPTKIAPTTPDGKWPYTPGPPEISCKDRIARLIAAEASDDKVEIKLLDECTPKYVYYLPDTTFPVAMLHVVTLIYVTEQLEQAGTLLNAFWCTTLDDDASGSWNFIAAMAAFRFRVGRDAWQQFTEWVGVDGDKLVEGNYHGQLLKICGDHVAGLAPSPEEMTALLAEQGAEQGETGEAVAELITADDVCATWRKLMLKAFDR